MSIASEITRLQGVKSNILDAIAAKGVSVPIGAKLAECPELISSISGGGTTKTLTLDIDNFDLTNRTDGTFYFDTPSGSISKITGGLKFHGIWYIGIRNYDPSKLKTLEIAINNNSFGNICYAGYNINFVACAGLYFTNYGVFQNFSNRVTYQNEHGMIQDWSGTNDGVGKKRYDHFAASTPIVIRNEIENDGKTNKLYANDNIVFECTYDIPQNELPLYVTTDSKKWIYDNFGLVGGESGANLDITSLKVVVYD